MRGDIWDIRDELEFVPYRPQDPDVEIMSEVAIILSYAFEPAGYVALTSRQQQRMQRLARTHFHPRNLYIWPAIAGQLPIHISIVAGGNSLTARKTSETSILTKIPNPMCVN